MVRPAREEDTVSLREIYNEAVQDGLATFETEARSLEEQKQLVAAADPQRPILLAELRGWVLGWITIQPYDHRPQLKDVGEVTVFVRRSFRNYGVGRQLMRSIQQEAQKLGYRKLVGRVLAENRDSLRLCRATGWREVGRHEQHARHNDALLDVIVVEYVIPPAAPG
jgi:phosphinothricin acetyltransferase